MTQSTPASSNPTAQPAWQQLEALAQDVAGHPLQELFAVDEQRVHDCTVEAAGLYLDYSRQRVTPPVMQALRALAEQQGLATRRQALLTGGIVNDTEQRAAWVSDLRAPQSSVGTGSSTAGVSGVLGGIGAFVG